jgi:chemosensory pili system protein ChpA (sensor histidine kinase/response regulator)
METGFTIDDVRETLTRDVTRSLGRIERAAREILDDREPAVDGEPASLPRFVTIGDHSHAIYGTSRLVSAQSLADSAARMEALSHHGRDQLSRAMRHLAIVRDIAAAMVGGSSDMMAMLSLELDGQSHEALAIADSWRLRVEDVLQGSSMVISGAESTAGNLRVVGEETVDLHARSSGAEATEAPEPAIRRDEAVDQGWSELGDQPARGAVSLVPSAPRVSSGGYSFASVADDPFDDGSVIDPDLAEVFAVEASSTLTMLDDALAALHTNLDDRAVIKAIERGFHTLKGAAATVGLAAVSACAADLQDRAELLVDAGRAVTAADAAALVRGAEELRRLARIPAPVPVPVPLAVSPPPAALAPGAFDEMAAEFEREARVVLDEAEHLLGNLRDADPAGAESSARALGNAMHRLRGSALVAGLPELAEAAAGIELLTEDAPVDTGKLAAALARCGALVVAPPQAAPSLAASLAEARVVFRVEVREAVDEAAGLVPALRDGDPTARARLARLFHRLKGSALVVEDTGLSAQAAALHQALQAAPGAATETAEQLADKIGALAARLGRPDASAAAERLPVPIPDTEIDPSFQQECTDLLELLDRTALALERSERPRDQIAELLRNYHTLKGVVNALSLRPIGDQLHLLEDLLESLDGSAILPPLPAIVGVLLPFHGELRRQLRTVRQGYVELVPGRLAGRLTRLLARASRSTAASNVGAASQARSRGSRLGDGSEASDGGASTAPDRRNIRVSIDRLDALMNLAGELVINRSRLLSRIDWLRGLQVDLGRSSRHVLDIVEKFRDDHEFTTLARGGAKDRTTRYSGFSDLELDRYEDVNILARSLTEGSTDLHELFGQLAGGLGALADDSDTLGTIVSGIQSEVTRSRMVPLDVLFSRLQLPVRDAAQREGRDVRIETSGTDVHLDKTIVDALFQPMLHLVRNAVSHGIEAPHVRLAAGKPAHGTVTLRARQELGQIVVEIIDDGAGLDLERLRERGAALGLIEHDTPLDDPRVRDLIFVHGLSTHVAADAVSGRGVGCDVVRRAVDRLNGSLRVDSERHVRTVFSITLPVTLAISRALLVRHAGETFAVPLYFTERIIDAREVELVESANQRRIDIDGAFVPVRPLGDFVSGPTAPDGPILLLQVGDQRLVVQVDEVLTQEEVVVKSLGALLRGHPMFAGVTIRGTGETVLILDVPSMTDTAFGRDAGARPAARRPRAVPELVAPGAPAEPAVALPAAPSDVDRPLHVLFVDDSVSVRKVAERALKQLGVLVTLAVDGVDALDKLRGGQFDLVFTDLEMPRMHGYELIRELRFLPAFHAMPVVVVTSRSGKKHRDEAQAVGASEYLTKPFTARSLAAALVKFGGARARGLATDAAAGGEATS